MVDSSVCIKTAGASMYFTILLIFVDGISSPFTDASNLFNVRAFIVISKSRTTSTGVIMMRFETPMCLAKEHELCPRLEYCDYRLESRV